MRKYQSHKVVEAAVIHAYNTSASVLTVTVYDPDAECGSETIKVPLDFFARGLPRIGDWLVRYEPDGYLSWSPRDKFEAGYTPVEK